MSWLWVIANRSGPIVLDAAVDEGYVAFVNGGAETELWGRTYVAGPGADRSAAAEFVATAHASIDAADPTGDRAITVIGDGLLAHLVHGLLPGGTSTEPDTVIDTTGSPDRIRRAVAMLPRLGHLVLAAPPRTADIDLATYRDLHVRGLTVTGVGWVSDPANGVVAPVAVDAALQLLACAVPGRKTQDAAWYALRSGEPA
jgi:hypothetical protein